MEGHSFFVGGIFEQRGHLNSGVIVGIPVLFFAAGVVVVGVVLRPPRRHGDIVQCVG